jgi:predicted peroxiredoxin
MKGSALFAVASVGLLVAGVAGCVEADEGVKGHDAGAPSRPRDGVFIHISSGVENANHVLMGLRMAELMSIDHDVVVYFDVHGIDVVTKGSPDLDAKPFNTSHKAVAGLISSNVPVYACPGCMMTRGKTADDLLPGVKVATKEAFFDFTRGRILTLDY